ncbi:hypothetical protein MASR2M15_24550 [Anaerolineales bacterium]
MSEAKIMIVDDDRTTTSLLKTLLELDDYEVLTVARGMDVIPLAETEMPDVILMDYHLADISGLDVLKDIRVHATLSKIAIIIASGMDMRDEVLSAGANDFILKPFDPSLLPEKFQAVLDKSV